LTVAVLGWNAMNDVLAIVLGIVAFAVLWLCIEGIDRV
jgi:hypothetical protein